MFCLYGFSPRRECWIDDSVLYVQNVWNDGVTSYDIKRTPFFTEHKIIQDVVRPMPLNYHVLFKIEDAEGNIIIGRDDATVSVVKDCTLIGCTRWDVHTLPPPTYSIGMFRDHGGMYPIYLDLTDHRTVYVEDFAAYGLLEREFPEIDEKELEMLRIISNRNCYVANVNVSNAYYIIDWRENYGLCERRMETLDLRGSPSVRLFF